MGKPFFVVILLAITTAVSAQSNSDKLIEMMQGSFSSKEQASNNDSYLEINLHMYRIWESFDEIYFYVEQAAADTPSKPYRQRVYMIEETEEGEFKSTIYTFHNEAYFAGKWKDLAFFENFDNTILSEKEGCSVTLKMEGSGFVGSTNAKDCTSEMRGASYATSEVKISADELSSWDRGFDSSDTQVWGATDGPYIFKRL